VDNIALGGSELLEAIVWDLNAYAAGADFPDDVSGLLFHYLGEAPSA
jgi:phosphoserine phosphatase RsbU/P